MKRLLTALCLLAGITSAGSAIAQTASYDAATRYLTIPSVRVGDTVFSDLVIRLDGIAVISVGATAPATSTVTDTCTVANFTTAKFNAIALGMSLDQVSQVMGCKNNPGLTQRASQYVVYAWNSIPAMIMVWFNPDGTKVTGILGSDSFKTSAGF